MAYSNVQLSVFSLLSSQSQLQAKIMDISETRTMISDSQFVIMNQASSSTSSTYSSFTDDPNYTALQLKDNQLELDQKKYQTQLDATMANLEAQQKLLDNNIKEDHNIEYTP